MVPVKIPTQRWGSRVIQKVSSPGWTLSFCFRFSEPASWHAPEFYTWVCKEIQAVHSEGDQPWDFSGRNDANAETPVLWPPHAKSWLIGKDSNAGRDWGQEEKGTTQDEMAGWHHGLDGRESEWTSGVGDGQGGLACCNSWGSKESDTTERLNWADWWQVQMIYFIFS